MEHWKKYKIPKPQRHSEDAQHQGFRGKEDHVRVEGMGVESVGELLCRQ